MRFRGDIEGLRGVAILMVVLSHAKLPLFGGGFVGVDVFFVISGYLITSLLQQELRERQRVDAWAFYARRVRRLLPAATAMLLGTAALAVLVLPAQAWQAQADAARWTAAWSSNVFFALSDIDYFERSAIPNLFLHTWSLGVEEQFYLLWPWLLLAAWRIGGGRASGRIVCGVAIVGFAACVIATRSVPIQAYYQMPFRLWQLALGGALCLVPQSVAMPPRAAAAMRWSGAGLLVASCLLLSRQDVVYPGFWALLPTAGAALAIAAGSVDGAPVFLGNRVFRALGRISYSWYLWHWPLLAVADVAYPGDAMARAIAISASVAIAWLSYRFIERPFRSMATRRPWGWVTAGLLISAALACAALGWANVARERAAREAHSVRFITATRSYPDLYRSKECDEWIRADRLVPCVLVAGEASGRGGGFTVLMIGDSVAAQWSPAFTAIAARAGWKFVVLTKSACPMVERPFVYEKINRRNTACERWRARAVAFAREMRPDLLVLGSSAAYPFSSQQWQEGTSDLLRDLNGAARHTVILAPTPVLPFSAVECVTRVYERTGRVARFAECSAPLADVDPEDTRAALVAATRGMPTVSVLDLNPLICPRGRCDAWRDGRLVFRDSQHLNAPVAASLAPQIRMRLPSP